ncbi:MAG: hypothetical protein R8M14_06025 [Ghiorsea sp.]
MTDSSMMLWSVLFGGIGMGYFMYGKKQKAVVPLCVGIALFAFPYVVSNLTMLLIVGVVLVVIPYFIKI